MNRIDFPPKSRKRGWMCAVLAGVVAGVVAAPARADVITEWNEQADFIALRKGVNPSVYGNHIAAVHVAMFEAVNAIERRYTSYKLNLAADRAISKEAAAAAAAHGVLVSFYPDQEARLDDFLKESLNGGREHSWNPIPEGAARSKGIALGREAAAQVVALRSIDGSDATESYRPRTQPGVYVPTTLPVNATLGGITPWTMASPSQFRPGPPPALKSETWTRDLNEIREFGARNSKARSAEQTDIARFWLFVGPFTYNPIVRQVATSKRLDLVDSARLFALTSMAGNDAATAVFEAKFTYNFWRPITAIRNADQTGNAATPRDATWMPLADTPMHPEYPCAHCIISAAVGAVLQAVVGNEVPEITMVSPTAPGVTRKWTRIQEYMDEVSLARIYAGFHYRFSTEVGAEMGRKIGEFAVATQMRIVRKSADARR
jgi:hypothetical protein